jgi:hypothetical protein
MFVFCSALVKPLSAPWLPNQFGRCAQIADIGVEPRSGRSLPAIRATAVARARSDPERRHGLGMLV